MLTTIKNFYCLNVKTRIQFIEGMRAIAVIMVFNTHCLVNFAEKKFFLESESFEYKVINFFYSGAIGVDLFFVLSGFLIYKILESKKPTFTKFMVHRALRLMPVNTLVLLLLALPVINWTLLLQNIFFLPPFFSNIPYLNFVTWSLGWEWLFYITMFLTFQLQRKLGKNYILYICMAVILFILLITHFLVQSNFLGQPINFSLPEPGRFCSFYIGIFIATIHKNKTLFLCRFRCMPIALVSLTALIYIFSVYWNSIISQSYLLSNLYFILVSLSYGSILLALLVQPFSNILIRRALESTPLRIIGQVSYSFYLIHVCFGIHLTNRIFGSSVDSLFEIILYYLIAFLISFIAASLLFFIFERPYIKLSRTNSAAT